MVVSFFDVVASLRFALFHHCIVLGDSGTNMTRRPFTALLVSLVTLLHGRDALMMMMMTSGGSSSSSSSSSSSGGDFSTIQKWSNTSPSIAYTCWMPPPPPKNNNNNKAAASCNNGNSTVVIFYLPGLKSSMQGRKGDFLLNYCRRQSSTIGYVALDYRAQGASHGDWATDATVTNFLTDALWVLDHVVVGTSSSLPSPSQQMQPRVILVGSSMGAWLGFLMTKHRPTMIHGLICLAPALDLTRYYPDPLTQRQHPLTDAQGRVYYRVPNDYANEGEEPYYLIYEAMLQDGERHCLFQKDDNDDTTTTTSSTTTTTPRPLPSSIGGIVGHNVSIRILHGSNDDIVPVERSRHVMESLLANHHHPDAKLTVIEKGNHRLSDPNDLQILEKALDEVVSKVMAS